VYEDAYVLLSGNTNESIHWYCTGCNGGVAKVLLSISIMKARQDKTDDDVKKLEDEIKNMRIELTVVGVLAHKIDIKLEGLIEKKNVEGLASAWKRQIAVWTKE